MAHDECSNPSAVPTGFLARLLRDQAGNTIALMTAGIIPVLGLTGGAIDMGRSYLSQSRLQQACDSGVLAARRALGARAVTGSIVPTDVAAIGNRFFDLNFANGSYGTRDRTFTLAMGGETAINGKATATVPTTIMKIFGYNQVPIATNCQAKLNYTNTDVMFVLDTTGSMGQSIVGDSISKIQAMRSVVKTFHATLEAGKSSATRVRYGFVPYSTNVNVGFLLKSDWVVDSWDYHGRRALNGGTVTKPFFNWQYRPISQDLTFLKGATGNDPLRPGSVIVPMGGTPSATPTGLTATFRGCMEERDTYEITDYANVDLTRALDLDLDLVPSPTKPATQWRPMLHEISYVPELTGGPYNPNPVVSKSDFLMSYAAGYSVCPAPAQKLQEMTADQVTTYLNTLTPAGSTYHDIGMIWGGRLLSATGLFASENADEAGQPTNRHLIFLTDGETLPLEASYGAYGIEPLDKRRWSQASALTLTQVVEKRFLFACQEVKKRNITVWIIGFGTTLTPVMTACAGNGHSFEASNSAELSSVFAKIASQMGELRIAL